MKVKFSVVALTVALGFAAAQAATQASPATQPSTQPALSASDRVPHPSPKPGETLSMDIRELGNFEFDEDKPVIPADVKALSGATVRLTGFMIPLDQAENITKFALVPNPFQCCMLGGPPQMQHTIIVSCPKGKAIQYSGDQIVVEGKLTVDLIKDDGYVTGIFAVETTSVKPASK